MCARDTAGPATVQFFRVSGSAGLSSAFTELG
jgi:ATP-dependent Zn protease